MLPGISKPEIPGKEFILFASEGMLQDAEINCHVHYQSLHG